MAHNRRQGCFRKLIGLLTLAAFVLIYWISLEITQMYGADNPLIDAIIITFSVSIVLLAAIIWFFEPIREFIRQRR